MNYLLTLNIYNDIIVYDVIIYDVKSLDLMISVFLLIKMLQCSFNAFGYKVIHQKRTVITLCVCCVFTDRDADR